MQHHRLESSLKLTRDLAKPSTPTRRLRYYHLTQAHARHIRPQPAVHSGPSLSSPSEINKAAIAQPRLGQRGPGGRAEEGHVQPRA
eukprot:2160332-Rhodomonas_salina.5